MACGPEASITHSLHKPQAAAQCYHCLMKQILALGILLLLLTAESAWAVNASIKQRTPFCRETKENCQPVFYLTPTDQIQIEGQTADGKWLRLKHLASGQIGWVKTGDVSIAAPSRLAPEKMLMLETPALAMISGPQGPLLLEPGRLRPVQGGEAVELTGGLSTLLPQTFRGQLSSAQELRIYGLTEVEKQRFLQEVQPALKPYPRFRSLLRVESGPQAVAWLPEGLLLVLGQGSATWGQSLFVGLDSDYLPVLLLRNAAEILTYLPEEARQGIRGESMRLLDLDADGTLIAAAYHAGARRDVLIRVKPKLKAAWEFEGMLYWPKELPFRPDAQGLNFRLWSTGEQSVLVTSTEASGAGYLGFYAGGNEVLTLQKLDQPILDGQLWQGDFWSLQKDAVTRWKPVIEETKK